jgi:hypothetical protein
MNLNSFTSLNPRTTLIIALALLCNTCAKDAIDVFGSITGVVKDAQQQQPIEGVIVSLNPGGITRLTGKDGAYSFIDLEAKQYSLTYSKNEYLTVSRTTAVQAGMNNVLDVTLEKEKLVPVLAVSTKALDFGPEKTTLSLEISNTGKAALNWKIAYSPGGWVTCSPSIETTAAGGKSLVVVTVNRSQKEKGTYNETFYISSDGGNCDVEVAMTVSGVGLSIPESLDFGALKTETPLSLANTGTSSIDYTVETSNDWIIPAKTSGTVAVATTDFLNVMVKRETLSAGDYTGSITIHAGMEVFTTQVRMSVPGNDKPSVSMEPPSDITSTQATFKGAILSVGKDRVTSHGFCWSVSPNPTVDDSFSNLGDCATPKPFESTATGLQEGTTYYVRAYAQNSVGIAYTNEQTFTTVGTSNVPVTSVSLDQTSLNKKVGDAPVTLHATVYPDNASNKNVSWSTDNPSVAGVNDNGTVTLVGAGSTNITVTTQDGNKTATCYVTVTAASSGTSGITGQLTWSYDNGVLTISGTGAMPDYTAVIDGTHSSSPWDSYRDNITTVNIQDGVTRIGNFAFWNCSSLTSITIPNLVTTIGSGALGGCHRLTSITLPNSVTTIGNSAFSGCRSLTSITIPNSVTSIGDVAFADCRSLTSITIPNSITTIGNSAFSNCSRLTSITVNSGNTEYASEDGVLFSKSKKAIIAYLGGKTGAYTIPNSVTTIGQSAFSFCSSLTSITIPNSVTTIGSDAFSTCLILTSITIGNSVTTIEQNAFSNCSSLRNMVVLITTPPSIQYTAFFNVPLSSATLTVPSGCKGIYESTAEWRDFGTIVEEGGSLNTSGTTGTLTWSLANGTLIISGSGAMPDYTSTLSGSTSTTSTPWDSYRSNITTVNIQNGVTAIGGQAFRGCSRLTSITIPNSVTTIGNYAFYDCSSLTSITIPNLVTTIGEGTFQRCSSLTSITLPNSVTTIGVTAFSSCSSLTSITIPNSVTTIGGSAFGFCSSLTSITLPNSVTTIGNSAFVICSSLTSITVSGGNIAYTSEDGVLFNKSKTEIIAYPGGKTWSTYNIPNSVTSIGNNTFHSCSSLTSITLPNSVTTIGSGAFASCSSLTSITIPNSVKTIGRQAFWRCYSLRNVVVLRTTTPSITSGAGNGDTFYDVPLSSAILTVPKGCKNVYKSTAGWKDFGTIVELEN